MYITADNSVLLLVKPFLWIHGVSLELSLWQYHMENVITCNSCKHSIISHQQVSCQCLPPDLSTRSAGWDAMCELKEVLKILSMQPRSLRQINHYGLFASADNMGLGVFGFLHTTFTQSVTEIWDRLSVLLKLTVESCLTGYLNHS